MVEVKKSICYCGKCGTKFDAEWDLEVLDVAEGPMGEQIEYRSDIECECPNCENVISGSLYVSEYPVGVLELAEVIEVSDSEDTDESMIEEPRITFWDL